MSCSKEADGKDLWDPLGMGPERKEDCSGERKGRMQWEFCFRAGTEMGWHGWIWSSRRRQKCAFNLPGSQAGVTFGLAGLGPKNQ